MQGICHASAGAAQGSVCDKDFGRRYSRHFVFLTEQRRVRVFITQAHFDKNFVSKPFLHCWEKDPLEAWDKMDKVYPSGLISAAWHLQDLQDLHSTLHPAVLNFLGCSDHTFPPVDNLTSLLSQRMIKLK